MLLDVAWLAEKDGLSTVDTLLKKSEVSKQQRLAR